VKTELEHKQHGFRWHHVEVERLLDVPAKRGRKGVYVAIRLKTGKRFVDVYATPSGLFRIFGPHKQHKGGTP
jgi:hypothetical protein